MSRSRKISRPLAVALRLFFLLMLSSLPAVSRAGMVDDIPVEPPQDIKTNLDFIGGWSLWPNIQGTSYRWELKLGAEFPRALLGTQPGLFLSHYKVNHVEDIGLGLRLAPLVAPIQFSDTGLRLVLDGTFYFGHFMEPATPERGTLEAGLVLDLAGLDRIGFWAGYDFTDDVATLMFSAGVDLASVLKLITHSCPTTVALGTTPTPTTCSASSPVTPRQTKKDKVAIVISGGGSTGAWAVGALEYLLFEWPNPDPKNPGHTRAGIGTDFDLVCGTSTGSLIAPMLMTDDPVKLRRNMDLLKGIYTSVHSENMFRMHNPVNMLTQGSVLSNQGLVDTIRQIMDWKDENGVLKGLVPSELRPPDDFVPIDWENILTDTHLGKRMALTTSCLQTSLAVNFFTGSECFQTYFPFDPMGDFPPEARLMDKHMQADRILDKATLMNAMLASASNPTLFPPVKVETGSPLLYCDGGLQDFTPIVIAAMNGATKIYAIVLSPEVPKVQNGAYQDLFSALGRTIDLFSNRVGFANVREAEMLKGGSLQEGGLPLKTLWEIRPYESISDNSNIFDPALTKLWYEQGNGTAREILSDPEERTYAESPYWKVVGFSTKKEYEETIGSAEKFKAAIARKAFKPLVPKRRLPKAK